MAPLALLLIGWAVFFGLHVATMVPSVRTPLAQAVGQGPYRGLFALLSLGSFALMLFAARAVGFEPVWQPPVATYWAPVLLMPVAVTLIVGAYSDPGMKAVTRHPFLWGMVLFTGAHLIANGDLTSILIFGGLFGFSLLAMGLSDARARRADPEGFAAEAAESGFWPFATWRAAPRRPHWRTPLIGLLVYGAVFFLHAWLIGVSAGVPY